MDAFTPYFLTGLIISCVYEANDKKRKAKICYAYSLVMLAFEIIRVLFENFYN